MYLNTFFASRCHNLFFRPSITSRLDSCQLIRLPRMPGGKLSPPLPPKKVMICMPPGASIDSLSSSSVSPSPLGGYPQKCPPPKGLLSHHHHHPAAALLASQLAGLSSLHRQSHGHPMQLQYGSIHRPSRIIEELNKTLALSMQRFERSVEPCWRLGLSQLQITLLPCVRCWMKHPRFSFVINGLNLC